MNGAVLYPSTTMLLQEDIQAFCIEHGGSNQLFEKILNPFFNTTEALMFTELETNG
jgi:hypothetical protein